MARDDNRRPPSLAQPSRKALTAAAGTLLALVQLWTKRIDDGERGLERDCKILREAILIIAHVLNTPITKKER